MKKRPLLLPLLRKWGESINTELKSLEHPVWKKERLSRIGALKDAVYLFGAQLGKEYTWANGFEKFSKEIGIDWGDAKPSPTGKDNRP